MERTCLECCFCVLDYEPDWSDVTPGNGLEFNCQKGHFGNDTAFIDGLSKSMVKRNIEKADTCPDFQVEPPRPPVGGVYQRKP